MANSETHQCKSQDDRRSGDHPDDEDGRFAVEPKAFTKHRRGDHMVMVVLEYQVNAENESSSHEQYANDGSIWLPQLLP